MKPFPAFFRRLRVLLSSLSSLLSSRCWRLCSFSWSYVGMMRVHMTFVPTVGLRLDSVTPGQHDLAARLSRAMKPRAQEGSFCFASAPGGLG
jgi:hypothetical protein